MFIRSFSISIIFVFLGYFILNAQVVPTEAQALSELTKRGIAQDVLEERLRTKGVNVDELKSDPKAIVKYKTIIEATVAELEKENLGKPTEVKATIQEEYDPYAILSKKEKKDTIKDTIEIKPIVPPAVIYGQNFFRDNIIKLYEKADEIKPREDYILGPGDQIGISIWGASLYQKVFEINGEGYIVPDNLPKILLKGLTFSKAKQVLKARYQNSYAFNSGNFDVSIKFLRTVSVGIYGAVLNPGSYTVSAVNTAFNAIVSSGGPSDIGSVRNIKLIRSGRQPIILDVYKYMNNPSNQEDYYLQDNDIIQIPIAEKVVEIKGEINIGSKFELLKDEGLNKLLEYCGGLKATAYRKNIQLRRIQNDEVIIIDIPLSKLLSEKKDFALQNGDVITIQKIPRDFENAVFVQGEVELAGQYSLEKGLDLKKLLEKTKPTAKSRMDLAYIKRQNLDQTHTYIQFSLEEILKNSRTIELQNLDTVIIFNVKDFTNQYFVSITGAVRKPINMEYDKYKKLRISDLISLAEGLRPDASPFGYLTRIDTVNNEKNYLRIPLTEIIRNPDNAANVVLEPKDKITVYSELVYVDSAYIRITGAVKEPKSIPYGENLSLKDLVAMAGGFKMEAAKNRIDVFRLLISDSKPTRTVISTFDVKSIEDIESNGKQLELQPYDIVAVRSVPEFQLQRTIKVVGEVVYPGEYPIVKDNQNLADVIKMAGGLSKEAFTQGATLYRSEMNTGFVVIRLDEAIASEKSVQNIVVKNGDIIEIPKINDVVSLEGAININEMYKSKIIQQGNRINVAFAGTYNAKYYIEHFAGGFSEKSNKNDVTVEYANGRIKKVKSFLFFKTYPKVNKGSIVRVGYKKQKQLDKDNKTKENTNWSKVVGDAVAQATAVLSLILLIRTINQ